MTRQLCAGLVDGFIADGRADAAGDYAQQIPVRVIASILGVPAALSDTFTGWVRDVLEFADDPRAPSPGHRGAHRLLRRGGGPAQAEPGDDLLSELLHSRGRRRAGGGERGARRGRPGPHRRGGHHLERHRLVPLAPGHPSRRPPAVW